MNKGERTRQQLVEKAAGLFNQRGYEATSIADVMAATGLYEDGKKGAVDESAYDVIGVKPVAGVDELMVRNRLSHIMLNEAAMATAEGVVRSPRDGDIGAIFGIGFPPFRGGPLRMIDALGADQVVRTLEGLAAAHGDRFLPCDALREMAEGGAKYYP